MKFRTPEEQRLLDNARPSERVIVRDFFELLDARLVEEGAPGVAQVRGDPTREELRAQTPPPKTALSSTSQQSILEQEARP